MGGEFLMLEGTFLYNMDLAKAEEKSGHHDVTNDLIVTTRGCDEDLLLRDHMRHVATARNE